MVDFAGRTDREGDGGWTLDGRYAGDAIHHAVPGFGRTPGGLQSNRAERRTI